MKKATNRTEINIGITRVKGGTSSKYRYGELPEVPEGTMFQDRRDLHRHGVHRPLMAGICGSATEAAESIVVSGGYEDDADHGDVIIYTGQGGNDPKTKKQVADQELALGNMGLVLAMREGVPVRVIRGATRHSRLAPPWGYRYDGLFRVEDCWHEIGKSGFRIWRFRLRKIEAQALTVIESSIDSSIDSSSTTNSTPARPGRRLMTAARIIRNTMVALEVKERHDFLCQVCGYALETPRGRYAEAAHIQPLGMPHGGPDIKENILCLCPNHHLLFDYGAFTIGDDLRVTGTSTPLRVVRGHQIDIAFVRYHREHYS